VSRIEWREQDDLIKQCTLRRREEKWRKPPRKWIDNLKEDFKETELNVTKSDNISRERKMNDNME